MFVADNRQLPTIMRPTCCFAGTTRTSRAPRLGMFKIWKPLFLSADDGSFNDLSKVFAKDITGSPFSGGKLGKNDAKHVLQRHVYSYKTLLVLHKTWRQSSGYICLDVTTLWAHLQHCLDQTYTESENVNLEAIDVLNLRPSAKGMRSFCCSDTFQALRKI